MTEADRDSLNLRKEVFREIKDEAYRSVRDETWVSFDAYHEFVTGLASKALQDGLAYSELVNLDVQDQAGQVADYLCPWAWKTLRGKQVDAEVGSKMVRVQRRDREPLLAALALLPQERLDKQQQRIIAEIRTRLESDPAD